MSNYEANLPIPLKDASHLAVFTYKDSPARLSTQNHDQCSPAHPPLHPGHLYQIIPVIYRDCVRVRYHTLVAETRLNYYFSACDLLT